MKVVCIENITYYNTYYNIELKSGEIYDVDRIKFYEGPVYHITIDPGENHYFSEKYVKPIKKIRREKLNKIKNEFENN
jgi:hypothetical protein